MKSKAAMPLFKHFKFDIFGPKWLYLQNSLLSMYKRIVNESYYDVLKIPESCSSKEVRDAFINLSKQNHPDKHLNDPSMHERFIKINEAYTVLINPLSRRAYDINLHHKKKLSAPTFTPPHRRERYNYAQHTTKGKTSESHKTNYSSYTHGDPYMWQYGKQRSQAEDNYYGIKGIKRVSNGKFASILILLTVLAFAVQILTIRHRVQVIREQTLERNRKNALLLAMAKEKARLYGNDYQINLLKKSLIGSFDQDNTAHQPSNRGINHNDENNNPSLQPNNSGAISSDQLDSCKKCKKCKRS